MHGRHKGTVGRVIAATRRAAADRDEVILALDSFDGTCRKLPPPPTRATRRSALALRRKLIPPACVIQLHLRAGADEAHARMVGSRTRRGEAGAAGVRLERE